MGRQEFAYLDAHDFRAFGMLDTPIYIYSFQRERIPWANQSALAFWNAESLSELQQRELTPYSQATKRRLNEFLAAFRKGEQRTESWTYYPKGVAISAFARCRGVSIAGHDEAMLVEIKSLASPAIPDAELRAIEALRHIPAMVSMIAEDGSLLLRNPAAAEFLSRTEGAKAVATCASEVFREAFADPADFDLLMSEARQVGYANRTIKMLEPKATYHSIQLTRISDPSTGNAATLWIQQDVSQLRDVSSQLSASEAALDIVLGLSSAPSLLISASNGRLIRANPAARRILQLDLGEAPLMPRIFVEEAAQQSFLNAVEADGGHSKTAVLNANGGRTFWATVLGAKLTFENDETILLIISDIDDLHKVATELEVALSLERSISEMQRRVLEIASHEFRTPLAVIDGAAQRIARRCRRMTPEEIEELADRIRNFVSALNGLLDKTIERAKQNLAGVHCEKSPGLIQQVVADVCNSFAYKADVKIDPDLEAVPEVWFDKVLFEQALVNLIENAIKYSNGRPRIQISAVVRKDVVEIYMRDWGIGVPPEDRENVFQERSRGSNVGELPGSGLGLFIVRAIFRAHGGEISIIDTPGSGTTMKIELPMLAESAAGAISA